MTEVYKFQKLRVYQIALEYADMVYSLCQKLPWIERDNLTSLITRPETSIVLNIAEGSTSQPDAEQSRFLGYAIRSYLETLASLDLIERRGYAPQDELLTLRKLGHEISIKLQAFRKSLKGLKALINTLTLCCTANL